MTYVYLLESVGFPGEIYVGHTDNLRAICGPQRGSVTAYGQIQTMAPRDLSGIFG